jgi:hypothetical protein
LLVINIIIIVIVIIFITDFSNHNIGAHTNTAAIPLIVVTDDETDTISSTRFIHHSSRVDKAKNPYPSITPINMDNLSLKGIIQ